MEKKTEEMNEELAVADKRLHDTLNQIKVANTIRSMIDNGKSLYEIREYVLSIVKVGLQVKEAALKEIALLHLQLAERHQKLVDKTKLT
jgi:hypothetical protein